MLTREQRDELRHELRHQSRLVYIWLRQCLDDLDAKDAEIERLRAELQGMTAMRDEAMRQHADDVKRLTETERNQRVLDAAEFTKLIAENERLKLACIETENEVQQILGKALGYPWFKDDQKNFPGATEADGVCVGEHVAATLADEAAGKLQATTVKAIMDSQPGPAIAQGYGIAIGLDKMKQEMRQQAAKIADLNKALEEEAADVAELSALVDGFMAATEWADRNTAAYIEDWQAIREMRKKVKHGQ